MSTSMRIPSHDTTRAFYIVHENVKGNFVYVARWNDTRNYVRTERTSKNDATFVYNPQVFSKSFAKTRDNMRAEFPNAECVAYVPNDSRTIDANATRDIFCDDVPRVVTNDDDVLSSENDRSVIDDTITTRRTRRARKNVA